ncbi:IS481 family transposase [Streptacidiphilus monticola]
MQWSCLGLHRTEVFVSHRNARLTVHGRRLLVERVRSGRPVAHVAAEMGISRATAHKWVRRWREEGAGPSRPALPSAYHPAPHAGGHRGPGVRASQGPQARPGPHRPHPGTGPSTVHRVLARHGLGRLAHLDRPTGQVIRRYERDRPGELVHVDIKKLGNIPDGGGHKVHSRQAGEANRHATTAERSPSGTPKIGYSFIHSAVDDHTRLAYSEILTDERKETAAAFWHRAQRFFEGLGITVERVLTDNGSCYRSGIWRDTLQAAGIVHKRTRPYRPQTNGKVERFNRTLLDEWAYLRPYASNTERAEALTPFLHTYNYHRCHTALGGQPPITRVNNPAGQYT